MSLNFLRKFFSLILIPPSPCITSIIIADTCFNLITLCISLISFRGKVINPPGNGENPFFADSLLVAARVIKLLPCQPFLNTIILGFLRLFLFA